MVDAMDEYAARREAWRSADDHDRQSWLELMREQRLKLANLLAAATSPRRDATDPNSEGV